jgi:hypothetical protein
MLQFCSDIFWNHIITPFYGTWAVKIPVYRFIDLSPDFLSDLYARFTYWVVRTDAATF